MAIIYGKVAKIMDEYSLVLNVGRLQGVEEGMVFLIYEGGDDIIDPETAEPLGKLEMVKGRVIIQHVQDKISFATSEVLPESNQEQSQVLSAIMAKDHVTLRGTEDRRLKLPVRSGSISGIPRINPIVVGDNVRSLEKKSGDS